MIEFAGFDGEGPVWLNPAHVATVSEYWHAIRAEHDDAGPPECDGSTVRMINGATFTLAASPRDVVNALAGEVSGGCAPGCRLCATRARPSTPEHAP